MSIEFDSIDSGFNTMKRSRNTEEISINRLNEARELILKLK